jgi:hypothetical protein
MSSPGYPQCIEEKLFGSTESESPSEGVMAKLVVTTDIAGFLAPLDQALFSDFLKLASYLHSEGYKDAAAVICISALEGHLRKLSEKAGIAVTADNRLPKSADALNGELAAKGAYSRLDRDNVAAWLGLRSTASSGEHDRNTPRQIALLIEGVRRLIDRYPA